MRKTEFIEAMKDYAKKYGKVVVQEIDRTSKKYTGLMVKRTGIPTPVVNLDKVFEDYLNEKLDLDGCFKTIDRIFAMKPEFDKEAIMDWCRAKTRLFLRAFGQVSAETIYHKVADLFLVPYIQIDDKGAALVRVTKQLMDLWNVDEDELFETATENQETFRPATITNLGEKIGAPGDVPIFIVSTESEVCGAAAILYNGVAERLKDLIGEDFYILPSSIHEVIVLPKSMGDDVSRLIDLVTMINAGEVDEEDRLTNSVYTYDFSDRQFKMVKA